MVYPSVYRILNPVLSAPSWINRPLKEKPNDAICDDARPLIHTSVGGGICIGHVPDVIGAKVLGKREENPIFTANSQLREMTLVM